MNDDIEYPECWGSPGAWVDPKMTDQMARFAFELMRGTNQTRAAELAGYSGTNLAPQGSRLANNPRVKAFIRMAQDAADDDREITTPEVRKILTRIARYGTNPQAVISACKELIDDIDRRESADRGDPEVLLEKLVGMLGEGFRETEMGRRLQRRVALARGYPPAHSNNQELAECSP